MIEIRRTLFRAVVALLGVVLAAVAASTGLLPAYAEGPDAGQQDAPPTTLLDLRLDAQSTPLLEVTRGAATDRPEDLVVPVDLTAEPQGTVLGWSTLRVAAGAPAASAAVELEVDGPGTLVVHDVDPGGTRVELLDSSEDAAHRLDLPLGASGWPTWSFSAPGRYVIDARPHLLMVDGETQTGPVARYVFEVSAPETVDVEQPPAAPVDPGPDGGAPSHPADPADPIVEPAENAVAQAPVDCSIPGLADDALAVSDGHFDYGVQVVNGTLRSRIKDDRVDPPLWRAPDSVLFELGATARKPVPSGATYAFLGEPGAPVWTIGQTQEEGVPWLGWNTQHASAISQIDGATTWRLDDVDGPGELFVYQSGAFGSLTRILGTAAGWPDSTRIPANVHAHANWSFTEPGVYRITTTHTARLNTGATVSSQGTLYVQVGPCSSDPEPTGPIGADQLLSADELTSANRGGVVVDPVRVAPGESVTLSVPDARPGSWLMPVVYSTPQQLGWRQVGATGDVRAVRIPARVAPGPHKLAVYDAEGLVGWAPLRVIEAPAPAVPDPADSPDQAAPASPKPGSSLPAAPAAHCAPLSGAGGAANGEAGGPAGSPASAARQSNVSSGHFDFGPEIVGDDLVARVKDDRAQPPRWVAPETLRFVLGGAARQQVPSGAAYSFLGKAGDPIWLLPQTQVSGLPWLGWNTQHSSVRQQVRGGVTFRLDRVSGPGRLAVYLTDSFGGVGQKVFGNVSGFPSSFDVAVNVHAHGNWVFTAPGTYQVTMTQSAMLSNGRRVSDQATLTFVVGGGPGGGGQGTGLALPLGDLPAAPAAAPEVAPDAAPPAAECVLPDAGADGSLSTLLPLGLALLVGGCWVLVRSRRGWRPMGDA